MTLVNLPAGQSIRLPGGGSFTITLDLNQDHRDNANFLVGGCAPPTPTTTTPTTSSSTTTTTIPCPPIPFILCEGGSINNDADIFASIAASAPGATLRISHHSFMSNGTSAIGDRVEIGDDSDVFAIRTNDFHRGAEVTVRSGVFAAPSFPLVTPCCPIPAITCGGDPVMVRRDETLSITPGTYGPLRVRNGAHLEPVPGQPAARVNVAGKKIKLTQNAVARAFFFGPAAQIRLGRGATVEGGFCVESAQTDKHVTLQCP